MSEQVVYSSSLLFGKPPQEAMEALKLRHAQSKTINHELAEWFTAYGRLRLQYVDQLKALLKKGDGLLTSLDNPKLHNATVDSLGLASPMWTGVLNIVHKEAELLDSSTRKMGRDMIAPLKVFGRHNDSNLIEMDDLVVLASSISQKEAHGDADALRTEWSERAPYFFEVFERYDYNRLVLLKDVFLKYQTDVSDVLETFKKLNETALEHTLSFNPPDEIQRFSEAVSAKTLPIELTKEAPPTKKAQDNGFTATPKPSHRKSRILSLASSKAEHSSPTKSRHPAAPSPSPEKKPKEKHGLRLKFGTIMRASRKKKSDAHNLSSTAIAESEDSSVVSGPVPSTERSEPSVSERATPRASTPPAQQPLAEKVRENVPEIIHETAPASSTLANGYPAMQPTKRSNSTASELTNSSSIQPSYRGSASSLAFASAGTVPTTAPEPVQKAVPVAASVPEAATESSSEAAAPPVPSARKHTSTDVGLGPRQPHGSAPAPPQQRRVSTLGSSLEPAPIAATATGSTMLSRTNTGTGGLSSGQIHHPNLTQPGLNASIVEIYNASFKDGQVTGSNVIGEIAFSYLLDKSVQKIPSKVELQVSSSGALPSFITNPMFIQQDQQQPNHFTIVDPSQIHLRTVGGLKYMLNGSKPPIVVHPIWKHEQSQSTVIISVKPADELLPLLESGSIELANLMVSVSITGAQAASAASKPSGSFNREKNRVTWNLTSTPFVFSASHQEERLIARFMTNGVAKEADAGIQLRFTINSEAGADLVSRLNTDIGIKALADTAEDPFSSTEHIQEDWSPVTTLQTVIAGSYSGHA
ncbi:hypothetical protein KL929_003077 [Ogataea haglerorum]|uniref:MHD domain-containing protein n=1 Tax=Ogataea haglerorum TaxID=1937702 RepID=A0ABQ7RFB0_9ASCO|nr:hypothetical protein KL913_002472 [Ogataea haglerorum]KAG7718674.1 hypothetical protein KL949_002670 [Ogataea haglerorum]KAG7743247.1 hypothetical protein KL932_001988 [Ogataea haglerorum]KAG7764563.1 hypothetical protein KL946_003243 [Ogataea haglerorum]KAG7767017.1 hypothetical protein KL931_003901 [Ogataea haglerorum]